MPHRKATTSWVEVSDIETLKLTLEVMPIHLGIADIKEKLYS